VGKKQQARGWSLVQLDELHQFMEQNDMSWNDVAHKVGVPYSTARCWNQAGKAPSQPSQVKLRAMIDAKNEPPHKTPEQILAEKGPVKKKAKKHAEKRHAGPGLKATSRATFTAPVAFTETKEGSTGAWQVTRLSPKAAAKRMQEAIAQTQVFVSTWHDLPPQKAPVPLVNKDMKAIEGAFSLAAPALKTVRAITTAYIAAHGSKADPKVVAWLTAEILSLVFGERPTA